MRPENRGMVVAEGLKGGRGTGPCSRPVGCPLGFVSWTVTTGDLWAFGKAPLAAGDHLLGVDGKLVRRHFLWYERDESAVQTRSKGQGDAGHSGHGTGHTLLICSFPSPEFLGDLGLIKPR